LRETVPHALEQEKIEAVATPSVDKVDYHEGKPLKFQIKAECAPTFSLKDYVGLPVKKNEKTVDEPAIDNQLETIRDTHAKLVDTPEAVAGPRSFVVVDYTGLLDGKTLPGGEAKGQLIDMSSPQAINGFVEGLTGAKAGEIRDISVGFPNDHPDKRLAGQQVIFKTTVSSIKEKRLPALDDDFAKDLGCQDLTELRKNLRQVMESDLAREARKELEEQIIQGLLERNPFDVPPSLVTNQTERLTERLKQHLLERGASEADWKDNEEKMKVKNRTEAERQVRLSYILSHVAEKENIAASDVEVEETISKSVNTVPQNRQKDTRRMMDERRGLIQDRLKEEKIFSFLIDKSQPKGD
jgi:trigger factor